MEPVPIATTLATLETIVAQLRALTISDSNLSPEVRFLIETAVKTPAAHEPLLRRLAAASPKKFETVVREVSFKELQLQRDSGEMSDDSENEDLDDIVRGFLESSDDSDSTGAEDGSDASAESESETDAESRLSDEDVEDAIEESTCDHTHEERQDIRKRLRDGEVFPGLTELVEENRREKKKEDEEFLEDERNEESDSDAEDLLGMEDWMHETLELAKQDPPEELSLESFVRDSKKARTDAIQTAVGTIIDRIDDADGKIEESGLDLGSDLADAIEDALATLCKIGDLDYDEIYVNPSVFSKFKDPSARFAAQLMTLRADLNENPAAETMRRCQEALAQARDHLRVLAKTDPRAKELAALDAIREEQRGVDLIIGEADFRRLVEEIGQDYSLEIRFDDEAVRALQTVAEALLVERFRVANRLAIHAGRTILTAPDMQLARELSGEMM